MKKFQAILEELSKPFPDEQVKWKVQEAGQYGATLVAYIDARDVHEVLDRATGGMWKYTTKTVGSALVGVISIYSAELEQWISREDTGTESSYEQQKGMFSDAMKRAAVLFGVGRFLYRDYPIIKCKTIGKEVKGKTRYFPTMDGQKQLYDVTEFCRKLVKAHGDKVPSKIWHTPNPKTITLDEIGAIVTMAQNGVLSETIREVLYSYRVPKSMWQEMTKHISRDKVMEFYTMNG